MNDFSPEHPASPMRWMRPLSVFLLIVVVLGLFGFYGCGGKTSERQRTRNGGSQPSRGHDLLTVALDMMQPDRLGIDSQPDRVASVLNQWRLAQLEASEDERFSPPLDKEAQAFLAEQLSPEAVERAEDDDFSPRDATHIRTSILMRSIVDDVTQGIDNDLERAQVLFDYVSRNVQLVAEDNVLPLTPYEILMFGEGTAADRAWVFAQLLRQLQLDAVIIKAGSAEESAEGSDASPDPKDSPWFVAAIIGKEARLFDPVRSTPVPSDPTASPDEITPATLADLAQPAVWEALAGKAEAEPLQSAFQKPRLEIIGTSFLWAPRHARLQRFLTGADAVVISENLMADSPETTSVLKRVAAISKGQQMQEEIHIWPHPETRLENFEALSASELQARWLPFQAPMKIETHPETKQVLVGPPSSRLQLRTRTEQLLGQRRKAVQGYLQVQLDQKHIPPTAVVSPEIRTMHAEAAEDAFFWSGVCQMELDKPEAAVSTFVSYLGKEQFSDGRHIDQARILNARCQMELDQRAEALQSLEAIPDTSPQAATANFLRRAWSNGEAEPLPEKAEGQTE